MIEIYINYATVSPEGSIQAVPSISNGNQSDNINATYICSALGGPSNTFHWTKLGEDVVISGYKLSIVDIAASDGGMYVCVVENPAGNDSITVSLNGKVYCHSASYVI